VMLRFLLNGMETYELNSADIKRVDEIKQTQFDTWAWNFGSNPKFNISKEKRFAGGKLSVQTYVENGKIADMHLFGDFFAKEGLDTLLSKLRGCLYKEDDIKRMLVENDAESYFYNITLEELLSCIV